MTSLVRRRALAVLAATLLPVAGAVRAQGAFPDRLIKLTVPYPPGALTDALGRIVAERCALAPA